MRDITTEIDGAAPADFLVSKQEIDDATQRVSEELKSAISVAARRIAAFHAAERPKPVRVETDGILCERRSMPIERVGLYIPGGSAPLFSTLLMLATPARIAGCKEIVLCSPCNKEGRIAPEILYAARVCGVSTIYKLGGAQAIAAMAYGTETIRPVLKIFGPGNRYVMKAKQRVSAEGVAIDMPAGPSEVLVMADASADPSFVAADLLSQAEHGADSQVVLLCTNEITALAVDASVAMQLERLPRKAIAERALENSKIIVLSSRDAMLRFANLYAPEHLIISMTDAWTVASGVTAAGSVFVGNYSPESAGDYASGTNHTLPTMAMAKAYSGIGTESFMHSITYQQLSAEGLRALAPTIISMAEAEGLQAHAEAVRIRVN